MESENRVQYVAPADEETYLDRVEAAAMSRLVRAINYGDLQGAKAIVALMQDMSLV